MRTRGGFARALTRVLRYEGGYSDHPDDPGGATNQGITQRTYDAWRDRHGVERQSVKHITPQEVEGIYHANYWLKAGCDQLPPAVAAATFDAAVHSGVTQALHWHHDSKGDWRVAIGLRLAFLSRLDAWPVFGRGWTRRMAALITEITIDEEPLEAAAPPERLLVVYDQHGRPAAELPIAQDLLLRVTPTRAHIRPDPIGALGEAE